jgi:hypothetical protein
MVASERLQRSITSRQVKTDDLILFLESNILGLLVVKADSEFSVSLVFSPRGGMNGTVILKSSLVSRSRFSPFFL